MVTIKNIITLIVFSLAIPTFAQCSVPNKVAFVTGGASGIGAATIDLFIKNNIKVGFLDINQSAGKKLAYSFSDDDIIFIEGDVSKVADIRYGIERTVEKFGHLDIIFANAGILHMKSLLELSEDDWHNIIDVNLKGVVFTVKEGLPYLIKNNGGTIVVNCSDQSFIGKPSMCAYGITKGGIAQFVKSTALEYGHFNIRINGICPATIKTPLSEKAIQECADLYFDGDIESTWHAEANKYPLKRYGMPQEAAQLVYFLVSDASSFITGGLYLIDGGLTAG